MKRESNYLSGNEVYYTNDLILLVKDMLRGKPHCQKGFYLIPSSYHIERTALSAGTAAVAAPYCLSGAV
jgi:hypothetical protein